MSKDKVQEELRNQIYKEFDAQKKKTTLEEAFEKAFKKEEEALNPPEFTPYINLTPKDNDDELI